MNFDSIYETLPGNGWLSKPEAKLLWTEAKRTVGSILEVGCYQGRSTVLLASLRRVVYVVDPFEGFDEGDLTGEITFAKFKENTSSRKITNVVLCKQRIEDWQPMGIEVGFAYLDGPHTREGTKVQIEKALLCRPMAIGIHDVNDRGEGVEIQRAAVGMLGPWTERVERLAIWRMP